MHHVLPKKSCALRHMIHRVFLGACAVASLNACHGPNSAPRQRPGASPPTTTPSPATSQPISVAPKKTARFQQARAVWAHAYRLTERLAPLAPKSF
ncbi:MAG: hypothetical protein KAI47_02155, partial [Deltaproteobacteria bacterium]|nr:hypothetical protein [Deltaproteobacteria bacterium]